MKLFKSILIIQLIFIFQNAYCQDSSFWKIDGNTNGQLNYIGTNDNFDLPFYTNGTEKMILTKNGDLNVGVGNILEGARNAAIGGSNEIDALSNSNFTSGWSNQLNYAGACIAAGQSNVISSQNGSLVSKSVALGWANTIQNHNQYLIGAANTSSASNEYCGAFGIGLNVNKRGSWYLGGRPFTNLTNNTANTLAIGWGGLHTALFSVDGLSLGTASSGTTNANDLATSRLDVDAASFYLGLGYTAASGVRLRNLPQSTSGNLLSIDAQGYLFKSSINEASVQDLQNQIQELTLQIDSMAIVLNQINSISPDAACSITQPNPQLEVQGGDVYLENSCYGVIFTSTLGDCYRLSIGDQGRVTTELVNCPY